MKKRILLIFTLGICSLLGWGQNYAVIDSLKKAQKTAKTEQLVTLLNQLGWELRMAYPDSTIYYVEKSLALANRSGALHEISKSYNLLGVAQMYKGDYPKAFQFHMQALDQAILQNDSIQIAYSYNNLGRIYFSQGMLLKAFEHFMHALEIFEEKQERLGMGYCYKSLANFYRIQNEIEKSEAMLLKALVLRMQENDTRGQISIYQELAELHTITNEFDSSLHFYDKAMKLAHLIHDKASVAELDLGISRLFYAQKDYRKALSYANQAMEFANNVENHKILMNAHLELGKSNFKISNYAEAERNLLVIINRTNHQAELELRKTAFQFLSKIAEESRQYDKAFQFYNSYITLKDSLYDTEMAKALQRQEIILELERLEKEYALLKATEEKNVEIIRQEQAKNIAQSIIILLSLVLVIFLWLANRHRRRKNQLLMEQKGMIELQTFEIQKQNKQIQRQNQKLTERNEKLGELNHEKDNLMHIMAHDLKSPFNQVHGLVQLMNLSGPLNAEQGKYLKMIQDVTTQGTNLIRDVLDVSAFERRGKSLQLNELDVKQFLMDKMATYQTNAQLKDITLKVEAEEGLVMVTEPVYLTRILENLVSNALKYSGPRTTVTISGRKDAQEGMVYLSVKDEGPGFSEEDKKHLFKKFKKLSAQPTGGEGSNGLGLAIVKTLTDRLNGEVELKTQPRHGSEFILRFPQFQKEKVS
jgi:signal transduction histidine kinase